MRIGGYRGFEISEAAKWGKTPKIQNKAEKTAKDAMTDGLAAQIKTLAQKDAQKGIYMDREYVQLSLGHMNQYVSPDRAGPMAQVTSLLQKAAQENDPLLELLDRVAGNCSVKGHIGPMGQTAEIYSPDGEMIAGYNSLSGGWTVVQTAAESKFLDNAASVYAQAFQEARAEMRAAQAPAQDIPSEGTSVNILA